MSESAVKTSDLGVRTVSAIVMIAVAGFALWLGGLVWTVLAVIVMSGLLWEWRCLAVGIASNPIKRGMLNAAGIIYIGLATWLLVILRLAPNGAFNVLQAVSAVVATDVGAYFAGRTIGGPKIAPQISPAKTWAGLIGGMFAAMLALGISEQMEYANRLAVQSELGSGSVLPVNWFEVFIGGGLVAVVAQSGDFLESWMKRRAGVKDSGRLIPGHGGLLDRLDGLLAVSFVYGIPLLLSGGLKAIS